MHCCIVLFLPVTQVTQVTNETGVLKLAFLASLATLWGGCCPCVCFLLEAGGVMPLLHATPTWGELTKSMRNLLWEDISQTLVWGKQSVRLSVAAFPTPEGRTGRKPGTHFETERITYEKTKQDHHHPCD